MSRYFFTDKVTNTSGKLINTDELMELITNPPKVDGNHISAKAKSACIGAHDLPSSKRKADVLKHDSFTMLRLDLDDNAPELDEISEELKALGLTLFFLYSTAKHKQIDTETGEDYGNRYRVIVPLPKAMTYQEWECSQIGLSIPFESDSCADRPQQIMFMPTRYDGDRYEFKLVNEGENQPEAIKALHGNGLKVKQESEQEAKENDIKLTKPPVRTLVGNSIDVFKLFNAQFTVEDVLRKKGYKESAGHWTSPWSKSGTAGGKILTSNTDGKRRYLTYSGSEIAHLGIKDTAIKNGNVVCTRSYDAFDMYAMFYHDGDQFEALRDIATKFFPEVDKHNKREYRIQEQNEEALKKLQAKEGEA
jgi:hypothetical protein